MRCGRRGVAIGGMLRLGSAAGGNAMAESAAGWERHVVGAACGGMLRLGSAADGNAAGGGRNRRRSVVDERTLRAEEPSQPKAKQASSLWVCCLR